MSTRLILDFHRATLSEALDNGGSIALIALADISSVTEFAPKSEKLPQGMSLIKLKKGDQHPVLGTPEWIYERIKATEKET
jgi:hypothetical protein